MEATLLLKDPPILLASSSAPNSSKLAGGFYSDAKICPDGTCVLLRAEDRSISLYDLPDEGSTWAPRWTFFPPDAVLSYEWFPGACSTSPAMFAFAIAIKDHPIQLLDGSNHTTRASYPIIDHRERFIAPHCMLFSQDGTKLLCGFENAIEILDVGSPGKEGFRLHTSATRSSKDGQKGIISCLAWSPDYSGLLAAGSFSGTIGLYDCSPRGGNILKNLLYSSAPAGVTKIMFHPASHLLYASSRLSTSIEVWDIRNLSVPKGFIPRSANTNQRIGFDIDSRGEWLAAGDENGVVSIHNAEFDPDFPEAVTSFSVSTDPISTTLFHPYLPYLLTASGARSYQKKQSDSDSSSSEDEAMIPIPSEPSLKLWKLE